MLAFAKLNINRMESLLAMLLTNQFYFQNAQLTKQKLQKAPRQ